MRDEDESITGVKDAERVTRLCSDSGLELVWTWWMDPLWWLCWSNKLLLHYNKTWEGWRGAARKRQGGKAERERTMEVCKW